MRRNAHVRISWWIPRARSIPLEPKFKASCARLRRHRDGESDRLGFMREIVFDTETTGLDPFQGHRLVEIGCLRVLNSLPTRKKFHPYFNPERDMPPEAFAVHGLSIDFLKAHAGFDTCVDELLDFLGDAPLIAHNAVFD